LGEFLVGLSQHAHLLKVQGGRFFELLPQSDWWSIHLDRMKDVSVDPRNCRFVALDGCHCVSENVKQKYFGVSLFVGDIESRVEGPEILVN
jgi:hypothetical protein